MRAGRRYPNTIAAYDAGYAAGMKAERERQAERGESVSESEGPASLTLDDIKAGKYTTDELIDRKAEVDALMKAAGGSEPEAREAEPVEGEAGEEKKLTPLEQYRQELAALPQAEAQRRANDDWQSGKFAKVARGDAA